MYRTDYHLHTNHSMDCEMPVRALCEAALRAGMDEICITDHMEFGHPDPSEPPVKEDWLSDIESARAMFPGLVIRAGMEIGDNPVCRPEIMAWLNEMPLDFRLLSLHLVDGEDPYMPGVFEGKTQAGFYRRYVESKLQSVAAWPADAYDAVAHLGYCAKFAPYPVDERPLRWRHAPDAMDALFRLLAERGKALEINTSGKRSMGEFLPDRELLTRFRELGGEFVTLGSDAHTPMNVGNALDEAADLAKACGIRYKLLFSGRKPMPMLL